MALESNNNEGLLGGGDDDFAALDSMGYTGQSQYGMNTVNMSTPSSSSFGSNNSGGAPASAGGGSAVGDGRDNGFSGVSGSLFDRIGWTTLLSIIFVFFLVYLLLRPRYRRKKEMN